MHCKLNRGLSLSLADSKARQKSKFVARARRCSQSSRFLMPSNWSECVGDATKCQCPCTALYCCTALCVIVVGFVSRFIRWGFSCSLMESNLEDSFVEFLVDTLPTTLVHVEYVK